VIGPASSHQLPQTTTFRLFTNPPTQTALTLPPPPLPHHSDFDPANDDHTFLFQNQSSIIIKGPSSAISEGLAEHLRTEASKFIAANDPEILKQQTQAKQLAAMMKPIVENLNSSLTFIAEKLTPPNSDNSEESNQRAPKKARTGSPTNQPANYQEIVKNSGSGFFIDHHQTMLHNPNFYKQNPQITPFGHNPMTHPHKTLPETTVDLTGSPGSKKSKKQSSDQTPSPTNTPNKKSADPQSSPTKSATKSVMSIAKSTFMETTISNHLKSMKVDTTLAKKYILALATNFGVQLPLAPKKVTIEWRTRCLAILTKAAVQWICDNPSSSLPYIADLGPYLQS